jgi:hypothetical protein
MPTSARETPVDLDHDRDDGRDGDPGGLDTDKVHHVIQQAGQ